MALNNKRLRLLVLCTGNAIRSQMAEAWFNHLGGDRMQAFSAGTHPAGHVHPLAVEAMAEVGLDLSKAKSKSLRVFLDQPFDYVVTVCDAAARSCPTFPGKATRLHWPFRDPTTTVGDENTRLAAFRDLSHQMRKKIEAFLLETASQDEGHRS
ncbi:MAG: arsenate reductase ArsC [Anaerolineales bacterium]